MDEETVVDAVRALLADVARQAETITYGQLVERVDDGLSAHLLREDMAKVLRRISVASDDEGRGLLTAIVVRDDTGRPGTGWFTLAESRGRDITDREAAWRAELDLVHRMARGA